MDSQETKQGLKPSTRLGRVDERAGLSASSASSLRVVREILQVHLSEVHCDEAISRWATAFTSYHSHDALFNSIVEFTREIAKSHNLDTIAKQNIRSGMFQRLLRPRS